MDPVIACHVLRQAADRTNQALILARESISSLPERLPEPVQSEVLTLWQGLEASAEAAAAEIKKGDAAAAMRAACRSERESEWLRHLASLLNEPGGWDLYCSERQEEQRASENQAAREAERQHWLRPDNLSQLSDLRERAFRSRRWI